METRTIEKLRELKKYIPFIRGMLKTAEENNNSEKKGTLELIYRCLLYGKSVSYKVALKFEKAILHLKKQTDDRGIDFEKKGNMAPALTIIELNSDSDDDDVICLSSPVSKKIINGSKEQSASGTNVDNKSTENVKKSSNTISNNLIDNVKESDFPSSIEDRTGISIVDSKISNQKSNNLVNSYNNAKINQLSSETQLEEIQSLEITSTVLCCSDITREPKSFLFTNSKHTNKSASNIEFDNQCHDKNTKNDSLNCINNIKDSDATSINTDKDFFNNESNISNKVKKDQLPSKIVLVGNKTSELSSILGRCNDIENQQKSIDKMNIMLNLDTKDELKTNSKTNVTNKNTLICAKDKLDTRLKNIKSPTDEIYLRDMSDIGENANLNDFEILLQGNSSEKTEVSENVINSTLPKVNKVLKKNDNELDRSIEVFKDSPELISSSIIKDKREGLEYDFTKNFNTIEKQHISKNDVENNSSGVKSLNANIELNPILNDKTLSIPNIEKEIFSLDNEEATEVVLCTTSNISEEINEETNSRISKYIVEMEDLLKKVDNTQTNDAEPLAKNECYVINDKKNSYKDQNENNFLPLEAINKRNTSEKITENVEIENMKLNAVLEQKNLDELNKILSAIEIKSGITIEMIKNIVSDGLHSAQDMSLDSDKSDDESNNRDESYFITPIDIDIEKNVNTSAKTPNTAHGVNPKDPRLSKILQQQQNFVTTKTEHSFNCHVRLPESISVPILAIPEYSEISTQPLYVNSNRKQAKVTSSQNLSQPQPSTSYSVRNNTPSNSYNKLFPKRVAEKKEEPGTYIDYRKQKEEAKAEQKSRASNLARIKEAACVAVEVEGNLLKAKKMGKSTQNLPQLEKDRRAKSIVDKIKPIKNYKSSLPDSELSKNKNKMKNVNLKKTNRIKPVQKSKKITKEEKVSKELEDDLKENKIEKDGTGQNSNDSNYSDESMEVEHQSKTPKNSSAKIAKVIKKIPGLVKFLESYINKSDNPDISPLDVIEYITNQNEYNQDDKGSNKKTNSALKQCENQLDSSKKSLKKRKTENLLSVESKPTETKKTRYNELDRLHSDINGSFIRNDVLNANGRRMSSIIAEKKTERQLKGWSGKESKRTFTHSKASDIEDIEPIGNEISVDTLKESGADDNLLIPVKSIPFFEEGQRKKKTSKRRKNNNIDHHCRSKFINSCLLCNESPNLIVAHYINEHRESEVFISRLTQSDIEGLLETPNYGHHIIELPNKFESMCIFCCKVLKSTISSWIEHFTSHTGEFAFECSECCLRFIKESQINKHIKGCVKGSQVLHNYSYNDEVICIPGFSCEICNFTQLHKANIIKHLKTEHELKIISDANVNEFKLFEIKDEITTEIEMRNETNSENVDHTNSNELVTENVDHTNSNELVTVQYPSNIVTESIDLKPIIIDSSEEIESLELNKNLKLAESTSSLCEPSQGNITTKVTDLIETPQIETLNIDVQIKEEPSDLTNLKIVNSSDTIVQNEHIISLKKEQEINRKLVKDENLGNDITENSNNNLNNLIEATETEVVIMYVENMGYHKMLSKLVNYYCSFKGCEFPATIKPEILFNHINQQHNKFWSGWCFICRKQILENNKYSLDLEFNHLCKHSSKLNINQMPSDILNNNDCFETVEPAIPQIEQGHLNLSENFVQNHANYCIFKPWQHKEGHKSVHISIHSFEDLIKKYKCTVNNCSFTSDSKLNFTFHLNEHINNSMSKIFGFECCYCSYIAPNNNDLATHIDFEHSASIYQCSLCFYRARSQCSTKYHQLLLHSQIIDTAKILCVDKQSTIFPETVNSLIRAMEKYVKPILCEDCGASFYIPQAYNIHKKTVHFVNSVILPPYYGVYVCIFCIYETNVKLKIISHTIHEHPNDIPCFSGRFVNKKSFQLGCVDESSIRCISLICLDESVKRFLQYEQPAIDLNISLDSITSTPYSSKNLETNLKDVFENFSNTNFITSEIPYDQKDFIRESCRIFEILTRNSGLFGKKFFKWKYKDGSIMEFENRGRWIAHLLCLKNANLLHENIIYDCPHCSRGFYLKELFQHMVKHFKHRCLCLHCGDTTILNQDIIKLHLLERHSNENVFIKQLMKDEYQTDKFCENYYYVCSYTHIGDNLMLLLKQILNVSMQSINNYKNKLQFFGCLQQYIPEQNKYNCYELNCRFSGKEFSDIRKHYYSYHENINTFTCKYCNYKFNKTDDYLFLQEIEEHLTYHSKYIIICKECKYVAANMFNLAIHVELYHDTPSIFTKSEIMQNSQITNAVYLTYNNYITNIITCPYCTLQYTKIDLANHIFQSHRQKPKYHCGYCGEISYFHTEAENHLVKFHTGKEIVIVLVYEEAIKYPENGNIQSDIESNLIVTSNSSNKEKRNMNDSKLKQLLQRKATMTNQVTPSTSFGITYPTISPNEKNSLFKKDVNIKKINAQKSDNCLKVIPLEKLQSNSVQNETNWNSLEKLPNNLNPHVCYYCKENFYTLLDLYKHCSLVHKCI